MGRIVASVQAESYFEMEKHIQFSGLVDTGATYLTMPRAWRDKFGHFPESEEVEMQTATGEMVKGELCGPIRVRLENYRPISTEVLFTDMEPEADGTYEPLIGYIPLEQSLLAVDMVGHRLIKLRYFDLK